MQHYQTFGSVVFIGCSVWLLQSGWGKPAIPILTLLHIVFPASIIHYVHHCFITKTFMNKQLFIYHLTLRL